MYSYVSVDTLKGTGVLNIQSTAVDSRVRGLVEHVSRQIDKYCNRIFHPHIRTLYFGGDGGNELLVPDLISVSTLSEDDNLDGTFDMSWGTGDYFLGPHNAQPTQEWGRPYTRIETSDRSGATHSSFARGLKNYEIVGTWGYIGVSYDTGRDTSASLDSTGTSITLDGTASGAIHVGMTLLVDSEQMYVTGIGSGTGTSITVARGQNGSTAGTHVADSNISYYAYPGPISEAVLIQAGRLWTRKDSSFASQEGFLEDGRFLTLQKMDTDVKQLLASYKRVGLI